MLKDLRLIHSVFIFNRFLPLSSFLLKPKTSVLQVKEEDQFQLVKHQFHQECLLNIEMPWFTPDWDFTTLERQRGLESACSTIHSRNSDAHSSLWTTELDGRCVCALMNEVRPLHGVPTTKSEAKRIGVEIHGREDGGRKAGKDRERRNMKMKDES